MWISRVSIVLVSHLLRLVRYVSPLELSVDNQLAFIENDCYARVSIGTSLLPKEDVSSTVTVSDLPECKELCSRKRESCKSFVFGVGPKGNASCRISGHLPRPEELGLDPDYDLYIRKRSENCVSQQLLHFTPPPTPLQTFPTISPAVQLSIDPWNMLRRTTLRKINDTKQPSKISRKFNIRKHSKSSRFTIYPPVATVRNNSFESVIEQNRSNPLSCYQKVDHGKRLIDALGTYRIPGRRYIPSWIGMPKTHTYPRQEKIQDKTDETKENGRASRDFNHFSRSFMNRKTNSAANCFLNDVPLRDLMPTIDYVHIHNDAHEGHTPPLYVWRGDDERCRFANAQHQTPPTEPTGRSSSLPLPIDRANGPHGIPSHDISTGSDRESYLKYYPDERSIFRRYTVTGQPCKNGTICQENEVAGFWFCQVENNAQPGWDYCCEPHDRCGFSNGFSYPWCYVGSRKDQWRPCSETYQPFRTPAVSFDFGYTHADQLGTNLLFPSSESLTHSEVRDWPLTYIHERTPPIMACNNEVHLKVVRAV